MSSQVFFKNNYVDIADANLLIIIHLVNECIENDSNYDDWKFSVQQIWGLASHAPWGLVDLRLDEILYDECKVTKMLGLLECARQEVAQFGSYIPKKWLNDLLSSRHFHYKSDYNSGIILNNINEIVSLISK
jgi:hypothetical protein